MEKSVKKLRKSEDQIKKEFEEYKKNKKEDMLSLKYFISHCNVIQDIIISYLNILKKDDKTSFFDYLLYFYPILSVEACKNYGVNKTMSEKERFFKLVKQLSKLQTNDLLNFLYEEIKCYDEIEHLIPKKGKEEKKDMENYKYCRWFNCYNTSIDYKSEDNEEYIFYNLSNSLITEFLKNKDCFNKRIQIINNITTLLEEVMYKRKEEERFCKHFEFLCLALTNCEIMKKNNLGEPGLILLSIENELSMSKTMNLEEIQNYLNQNKYEYTINGDTITINYNKIKFIINDYHAYNLNGPIIQTLLNQKRFGYSEFLEQNKKFNEYINNQKYKECFFMKVIKKFSQSKLAITSIEKIFNIEKKEYEQLFKVLSEDIENYIYI